MSLYAATAAAAAAGGLLALKWHHAIRNKRLASGVLRGYSRALVEADDGRGVLLPPGGCGPGSATGGTEASSDAESCTSVAHRLRRTNDAGTENEDGTEDADEPMGTQKRSRSNKATVDAEFARNLASFLRICIPGVRTRETAMLVAIAALLGARSYLDLWASSNGGHVVKAIVSKNRKQFVRYAIRDIGIMMLPMAFVNNSLRYSLSRLQMMWRRRLSLYFHDRYLAANTFYKLSNLDARIRNVDQLLTVDVDRFCSSLAELYSNLSKPSIDVVLFSRKLSHSLGPQGPMLMIGYFGLCSILLRSVQPPFGQLTSDEQRLEGEYRLHHSRLIAHSEEIAFYGGGEREKLYINRAFEGVVQHMHKLFGARWRIGFVDSILVKYVATIVGYMVVSIPVFFADSPILAALAPSATARTQKPHNGNASGNQDSSDIAGLYTRNSRLLLQLAGAVGRLVLAGKEINRLTGYVQRVANLRDVLGDLAQQNAVRKRFESSPDLERDMRLSELMRPGKLVVGSEDDGPDANVVRFIDVNLISPDSVPLVTGMTFDIPRGCHVLVTGPNGSGYERTQAQPVPKAVRATAYSALPMRYCDFGPRRVLLG